MNKNIILNNGEKMPIIGIGTDLVRDGLEVKTMIKSAIYAGYRLIDTADLYGNERGIGEAIKECIDEGIVKREDLFIQTKAPFHFDRYNYTYKSLDVQLQRLGLDYVDMYLLHHAYRGSFTWRWQVMDIYRALETLYRQGKTKNIGVCNFGKMHLNYLLSECDIKPQINQIEFHPQHQQRGVVELCKKNDIQVQGWGTLNNGRIFDEPLFDEIGKNYNKNAAQIAIKYAIQKGVAPLVRSQKPNRQKEMLDVFNFEINSADMKKLDDLDGGEFSHNHEGEPIEEAIKSKQIEIKKYKMFGFLPFMKKYKKNRRITKYYLFGIPIVKTDKKIIEIPKDKQTKTLAGVERERERESNPANPQKSKKGSLK